MNELDLANYKFSFSLKNKLLRLLWNFCYVLFFRYTPSTMKLFRIWRIFILKSFGAKIEYNSLIYSNVKIWAPWNFEMGGFSCIGNNVKIYNQGKITLGNNVVISQNVHLCASTHDYTKRDFPLVLKPIIIGNGVWIAADAFVGPNVTIGNHVVVAARSVVVKNIESNYIVGGNPATTIKIRQKKE